MSRMLVSWCLCLGLASCTNDFDPSLLSSAGGAPAKNQECSAANEGQPCAIGTCRGLECCDGCWDGERCRVGDSVEACGGSGRDCLECGGQLSACDGQACVAERAVRSLAASAVHTCASDIQNTLWCWGDNASGASGGPNNEQAFVEQPAVLATGSWIEVAAGGLRQSHACAIHFPGSLWCWGDNSSGQLGLGPNALAMARAPAKAGDGTWLTLAAGEGVSCGIQTDSTLWCWGSSDLGRNAHDKDEAAPRRVGAGAGYSMVSLRSSHGCAVLDRELYCWGADSDGQLGLEVRPEAGFQLGPALVSIGTGWRTVAVGTRHTCGVRLDGNVWCWGNGEAGQAGPGGGSPVPTQLPSPTNVATVAAGAAHSCALDSSGALFCWGANDQGQLGVSGLSASESPVAVAQERRFRAVAAGYRHTCAVADTGVLYCWGAAESGQLGLGTMTNVFTPRPLDFE